MKFSELIDMSDSELKEHLKSMRDSIASAALKMNPTENKNMRFMRRDIARILTLMNKRKTEAEGGN